MKKGLFKLMSVKSPQVEQHEDLGPSNNSESIEDHELFNEDKLREIARERYDRKFKEYKV